MNFLKLVQETRKKVGLQGTGPSSVDVNGYESQIVSAVQSTWVEIQNLRSTWKWMRAEKTFLLTPGKTVYTLLEILGPSYRHKKWLKDTFYVTNSDNKKIPMRYLDYDVFRSVHINNTTLAPVYEYTIRPYDKAIIITPPNSAYTMDCGYQKSAQNLVSNTDTPEMPADFHWAIVFGALEAYGAGVSFAEIDSKYSFKYATIMGQLLRDQCPEEKFKVEGIV